MKKLLTWLFAPLLMITLSCSSGYNDTELRDSIKDLYTKISSLEKKVEKVNTDISDLSLLVEALQNNVSVVKVDETATGYTIILSDNTVIKIDNTVYEESGAPVIGVKLDEDGFYYWTITTDNHTDWLKNKEGEKIRIDRKKPDPKLSVDAEGLWVISYDGGLTIEYILDAEGQPVSAIQTGTIESIFSSVTHDFENVYFILADGSVLTVPKTVDFYMIIRQLPETVEFELGEEKEFLTESKGIEEVVATVPYGWKSSFEEGIVKIKAPAVKEGVENQGEVVLLYFGEQGKAGAVKVKVTLKEDYTGVTDGNNFSVDILEIKGNSIKAKVIGKDPDMEYYVYPFDPAKTDEQCIEQMKKRYKVDVNEDPQYVDYFHKGTYDYKYSNLTEGQSYNLGIIGVSYDLKAKTIEVITPLMKVPFTTSAASNFISVYRFEISNQSWYGVDVNVHPSDNEPYLFTIVKKEKYDAANSASEFAKDYIDNKYLFPYYNELIYDYTLEWSHFTHIGDQSFAFPSYMKRDPLYTSEDLYPLEPSTNYYAIAFGCNDNGEFSSTKVSKKAFTTPPFVASEKCTFKIEASAKRQDLNITIIPTDPNVTFITFIDERDHFSNNFSSPLQYAAYDVYWRKQQLKKGQDLSSSKEFYKGRTSYTVVNLKASYTYIVYAYGCNKDGKITTEPEIITIVTESSGN